MFSSIPKVKPHSCYAHFHVVSPWISVSYWSLYVMFHLYNVFRYIKRSTGHIVLFFLTLNHTVPVLFSKQFFQITILYSMLSRMKWLDETLWRLFSSGLPLVFQLHPGNFSAPGPKNKVAGQTIIRILVQFSFSIKQQHKPFPICYRNQFARTASWICS